MKKKIVIFFMLIMLVLPINAKGLSLSCRSCILMDIDSGRILYEKDINNPRLIASITKIMTAIIAIENGNLDDTVIVGEEVLKMYGSNIYLELGEKIKLKDLLYGLMLRSGNDAAVVIAKYIAGSEEKFVEMMNKKAQAIGMRNTLYNNGHGLDEQTENKSTAYDMGLLSIYAYNNSIYREIAGTKKYKISTNKKSYSWSNRNKLLFDYKYLTTGKTGYTPKAGKTLVTTATKDNLNLTEVVLNDGNHYISHKEMYEYGFNNYKTYRILDKKKFKIDDNFYKDTIYIKNNFSYPLTELEKDSIKIIVKLTKLDNYTNDSIVGVVIVTLDGKEIYRNNIYVKKDSIRKKNILVRLKEWIFG